jgi:hypothetical protein
MNKSSDCGCIGCMSKDERIKDLKTSIKSLKESVADAREMAEIGWQQANWWRGVRTGRPANIPRPRHLNLVTSQGRK